MFPSYSNSASGTLGSEIKVKPSNWVHMCDGNIPPNAVIVGKSKTGENIYVGRANHSNGPDAIPIPGKIIASSGVCFIPLSTEIAVPKYEVLVETSFVQFDWLTGGSGTIPAGAVMGNRKPDGHSDFIGRTVHEGESVCGKVHVIHKCLYFPYQGKQLKTDKYEVLVCRMIDL